MMPIGHPPSHHSPLLFMVGSMDPPQVLTSDFQDSQRPYDAQQPILTRPEWWSYWIVYCFWLALSM